MTDTYGQAELTAEIGLEEGRRSVPYKDSLGFDTVGEGHNLDAGPLPGQTYPMTNAEIDALTASDTASTVTKLDTYLPWWRTLDPVRQRVLLNMCFQLGIGQPGKGTGLLGFGQFLNLVQARRYADAATDMLGTLWAKQTPNRAKRLSAMMRTGVSAYPANIYKSEPALAPKPNQTPVSPGIAAGGAIGAGTVMAATHGAHWPLIFGLVVVIALVAIGTEMLVRKGK